MPKAFKIRSLLICDDIRTEISGKDICIGVYNSVIIMQKIPGFIPKLSLRIEFERVPTGKHTIDVRISDPIRNRIFSANGELEVLIADEPGSISFGFGPVHFVMPGKYTVHFGVDEQMQLAGSFKVRTVDYPTENPQHGPTAAKK